MAVYIQSLHWTSGLTLKINFFASNETYSPVGLHDAF